MWLRGCVCMLFNTYKTPSSIPITEKKKYQGQSKGVRGGEHMANCEDGRMYHQSRTVGSFCKWSKLGNCLYPRVFIEKKKIYFLIFVSVNLHWPNLEMINRQNFKPLNIVPFVTEATENRYNRMVRTNLGIYVDFPVPPAGSQITMQT